MVKESTYMDLLADAGIGSAHPGGLALTKRLLSREAINSDSVVLDVGCGTGETSAYIARKYHCNVYAIDINPVMLQKARQRFEKHDFNVKLIKANTERMPFRCNSFDYILAESVTVFTNIRRSLQEYARVLKPGGILLDIDMAADTRLTDEESNMVKDVYGIEKVPTEDEWLNLLTELGFTVVNTLRGKMYPTRVVNFNLRKLFSSHFILSRKYYNKLGFRVYRCIKH